MRAAAPVLLPTLLGLLGYSAHANKALFELYLIAFSPGSQQHFASISGWFRPEMVRATAITAGLAAL